MPERWEQELRRLRGLDAPDDLRARALEGPRGEPPRPPRERFVAAAVALAVFVGAGVLALRTFGPTGPVTDGPPDTGAPHAVIGLASGDAPRASLTYDGRSVDGVRTGYEWCDAEGSCGVGTADFAFYPPVNDFVVVPPSTPIEVRGDGTIERMRWSVVEPAEATGSGDASVEGPTAPGADGLYALEIDAVWEAGSATFFFGIQTLSSSSAAPDVLGVDCSVGIARLDTAVVRTQPDGLHVSFTNTAGYQAFRIVTPQGGPPDEISVGGALPEDGTRAWGIPPGRWAIGCGRETEPGDARPDASFATFELIDPDDHAAPELTCDGASTEDFTSTVPSSTSHAEAAGELVAGLADGDVLRGAGYGAGTFKLGPTYVVDRDGVAVARLVLNGDGPTFGGSLTACPDGGIHLSEAASVEPSPIVVTTPRPQDVVTSPVTIAGTADVFEAVVSIRIIDTIGNVVAETTTMATCGTGCRGDFSTEVAFAVAEEQPGEIVVYEVSAKDGRPINEVRIPVTLVPGDDIAAARAFLGPWTDEQGRPLPEDVLTVYLGAEHCSWGDIVFLRLASTARTTEEAPTYVRDTTGELAELSRGTWAVVDEPPSDAVPTGLSTGIWALSLDPTDPDAVFLVNASIGRVERWPALRSPVACD